MPHAEVNDQRIYYEVHGEGDPLLCVMGLGTDIAGWRFQLPVWSGDYRTIVFDNRDVGRSSYADAPYEITDMAADAIALADQLGLGRFRLVGISMGGAVAQEIALAGTDRILSLTLAVSYAGAGRWARERARLQVKGAERLSEEDLIDDLLLLTLSEEAYERGDQITMLRNLMLSYPYRQRRDGFIRQLEASTRHDARDRLGALRMPVQVIGAERDLLVPVWKSRELAALIPDARLAIIEAGAHAVNIERAVEFNELVLNFLSSTASAF